METRYQTSFNNQPVKQVKNRLDKIKSLFMRLKKAHRYYRLYGSDPKKHEEILIKAEPLIKELEGLGVHKSFSEVLLFFGKEFIDFEFGSTTEQVKNKSKDGEDVVSRAEKVFGVKATPMSEEDKKYHAEAEKLNARVYKVVNGKVEVLLTRNQVKND